MPLWTRARSWNRLDGGGVWFGRGKGDEGDPVEGENVFIDDVLIGLPPENLNLVLLDCLDKVVSVKKKKKKERKGIAF